MKNGLEEMQELIQKYTDVVYDNIDSFEDEFITAYIIDIYEVAFMSDNVRFNYILDCGQHIADSIPMEEFRLWVDKHIAETK